MLSYRHAFHAGNHADVLKHIVEIEILNYLAHKQKPFWYIDTHAGAGVYSLAEGYATLNSEFNSGIGRLWQRCDLPAAVKTYVDAVRILNPDSKLTTYPGSPWYAHYIVPKGNSLRLFERHPTDSACLRDYFAGHGRRTQIIVQDGFEGIKAVLPPPPRRALTLIDPSYEEKRDYHRVINALQQGLQRFATGVYAIWYPILRRAEAQQLPNELKKLPVRRWLNVTLSIARQTKHHFGMVGSGLVVLNPPWTLNNTLQDTMPWLVSALAQDDGATFTLEQQEA